MQEKWDKESVKVK